MTQLFPVPGKTEIQLTARGRGQRVPQELRDVPGGLYPLMSAAFEIDEYRMMSGWPVPVPDCDIRIDCLVTGDGAVLTERTDPMALVTTADLRWVADDAYYDQITGQWAAIQGSAVWEGAPENLPTLVNDYEYTIGDERFNNMKGLNFDSDTHDYLSINLDLIMGGTSGYTVIMVVSPNSIYGNNTDVIENALWGPQDTDGAWVDFTLRDQSVFMTTESLPTQQGVAIGNALSAEAPYYLVLVVQRPMTTLYAASGPGNVASKPLAAGQSETPLSTRFWLGNSPAPACATTDMMLLDLSIYGNPLLQGDVVNEIATLSSVYGGGA